MHSLDIVFKNKITCETIMFCQTKEMYLTFAKQYHTILNAITIYPNQTFFLNKNSLRQ